MAIISFWNNRNEETGKSSAVAAISTFLGINHNYKILVLSTKYNDYFYQDCYWKDNKNENVINAKTMVGIGEGMVGLSRAILSNKVSPEIITNYTKIVLNDNRLEILYDNNIMKEQYETHKTVFNDIVKTANKFYDLVFVDIDSDLDEKTKKQLIETSNIVIGCVPQKPRTIKSYLKEKKENKILENKLLITLLCKYDIESKFNKKVVSKFLKEKNPLILPYNTAFMDACNEGKVADYFIKYMKVSKKDKNAYFMSCVSEDVEQIIYALQNLQLRI